MDQEGKEEEGEGAAVKVEGEWAEEEPRIRCDTFILQHCRSKLLQHSGSEPEEVSGLKRRMRTVHIIITTSWWMIKSETQTMSGLVKLDQDGGCRAGSGWVG